MDTTERDLLMLSQRLMLIPISMDGLGYRTYGYGYPYAYGAYGYYGKRSADAEPKADADPYLLYGGYGLGLALFKSTVFLDEMKVITSDDNSALHFHFSDDSCSNSATNKNVPVNGHFL